MKKKAKRQALISRKTNEVNITGKLVVDGSGKVKIDTGFESLNHLLMLFSFHGFFDLELKAEGDLRHHIVEDIGIALGSAFKKAIADGYGIRRFGYSSIAMDEILAKASIDVSGRSYLYLPAYNIKKEDLDVDSEGFKDFLKAFIEHAKITVHIEAYSSESEVSAHHYFEAVFKAIGKALDEALQIDPRRKTVPSTKGVID